jgi:hypothetical protein
VLVMTPEEFDSIPETRFASVQVEQTVPYPDGRPGFYFVRLEYVDNIHEVITAEEIERRRPQQAQVLVDGQVVQLTYPRLDIGAPEALFDGDPYSMARSWAINPMVLGMEFLPPRPLEGLSLRIGGAATTIEISVWMEDQPEPVALERSLDEAPVLRDVHFDFPQPGRVARLEIRIKNTNDPPDGYVHLWEIDLK